MDLNGHLKENKKKELRNLCRNTLIKAVFGKDLSRSHSLNGEYRT